MASLEGLKTWFEYDVLIKTVLFATLAFFWIVERFVSFIEFPTLTPRLVLALVGLSLVALLFVLWESGR